MGSNSKDNLNNSKVGMAASSLKNDFRPVKSKGKTRYASTYTTVLALAFHVHLQEVFKNHPEKLSAERIRISFDVLDAIIGEMGSFSSV